ncbi:hypothetical protein [Ferruginibacter sp.]
MKKHLLLLSLLVALQVCLPTLKSNVASACDTKCSMPSFQKKKQVAQPSETEFEQEGDSGLRPFPFTLI